jgi:C-terminal domain of 1-Cys peroxiredoxin
LAVDSAETAMRCGKDKHGEVCPANWKEGGKTIRADPTSKLEYFAMVDGAQENGKVNGTKRARVD